MDPLAHTLVGAALAETQLARATSMAFPALLIGANLPDVDAATYLFADADTALAFRRGWTHGVLAVVILPLVLWGLLLGWDAWRRSRGKARPRPAPGLLLILCYIGVISHPLLDWLNTYGVRFLMPFDGRWFYGDALFIIDPWLWLLLAGAVLLARRGSRHGHFTVVGRLRGERIAAVGTALAVLYIGLMLGIAGAARTRVAAELAGQGIEQVERLMVGPMPANPFHWDVVAQTADGYHHGSFRYLGEGLELSGVIDRPAPTPILQAASEAPHVQGAIDWMRFPFSEVEESPEGWTVFLIDARYVRVRATGFGVAMVQLDRSLQVRE